MNQQTYTTGTTKDREPYVDRNDNKLIKMIIPFLVGLVVGYGANGLVERSQHNNADNTNYNQSQPINDGR